MKRCSSAGKTVSAVLVAGLALFGATKFSTAQNTKPAPPLPPFAVAGDSRRPVVVELFTSEGCSSCPPADEFLEKLDRTQPVGGAQIIVLSEHVDYWNDDGWRDPFSSHAYSERQDAYASRFHLNTVYTPQMVIDGRFETVGSLESRALQLIQSAAQADKTKIGITIGSFTTAPGRALTAKVDTSTLPADADISSAEVLLAVADESDESQVRAGENNGRTLTHTAVLRRLDLLGKINKSKGYSGVAKIAEAKGGKALRIIVIVQAPNARIWGAASERVEPAKQVASKEVQP